jgi:ribonuclease I
MKYRLQFHPNPEVMTIHIDKRVHEQDYSLDSKGLPDGYVLAVYLSPPYCDLAPEFIVALFGVEGVQDRITVFSHAIRIAKARHAQWKDIIPGALDILGRYFDPDGPIEACDSATIDNRNAPRVVRL